MDAQGKTTIISTDEECQAAARVQRKTINGELPRRFLISVLCDGLW